MAIIREQYNSSNDLYFLDIKLPKNENGYFNLVKAGDWENKEKVYGVSGKFKGIRTKEVEIEQEKYTEIQIWLEDQTEDKKEEMYVLRGLPTFPLRSLLNKLLNIKQGDYVKITISTMEKEDKNIHYLNLYTANDEKVDWKLSWDEQKKMVETIELKNGKKINDYTELNNYFIKNLPRFVSETEFTEHEEYPQEAEDNLKNLNEEAAVKKATEKIKNDDIQPKQTGKKKITDKQVTYIKTLINKVAELEGDNKKEKEEVVDRLNEQIKITYNVESTKDLTSWEASKVIDWLNEELEKAKQLAELKKEEDIPF